jgi:hypothetical protein
MDHTPLGNCGGDHTFLAAILPTRTADVIKVKYKFNCLPMQILLDIVDSSLQKRARYLKTGNFLRAGSVPIQRVFLPPEEVVYPSLG